MPVLDTNVLIERIKNNEEISENTTEINVLEYPPILKYPKFYGKIYFLRRVDINLALKLQVERHLFEIPIGLKSFKTLENQIRI